MDGSGRADKFHGIKEFPRTRTNPSFARNLGDVPLSLVDRCNTLSRSTSQTSNMPSVRSATRVLPSGLIVSSATLPRDKTRVGGPTQSVYPTVPSKPMSRSPAKPLSATLRVGTNKNTHLGISDPM